MTTFKHGIIGALSHPPNPMHQELTRGAYPKDSLGEGKKLTRGDEDVMPNFIDSAFIHKEPDACSFRMCSTPAPMCCLSLCILCICWTCSPHAWYLFACLHTDVWEKHELSEVNRPPRIFSRFRFRSQFASAFVYTCSMVPALPNVFKCFETTETPLKNNDRV